MRREVVYRGMDAGPRVAEALDRATRHIEKQVSRFGTRAAFLRVVLDSHPVRSRFTVSARLTVRRAVLHAREERPDPVVSIRETFSELKEQLKRHMSQFRREHQRDRSHHEALVSPEDLARTAALEIKTLKPLDREQLSRLRRFVLRETFYRRLDGRFPHDVSADSVLDETVVLALENADERPPSQSYDSWLLRLARRVMDKASVPNQLGNGHNDAHVEMEAYETGLLERPTDDDWLSYFQPDEDPTVGDITEDPGVFSPEQIFARHELQAHVHKILGQLPESWRHAFTLTTIEGFDAGSAATSLEMSPRSVQQQVAWATEFLREKLRETGYRRPTPRIHA